MSNADFFEVSRNRFRTGIAEFSQRWGWYFALGVFLVILGAIAIYMSVATTVVSVMVLGVILLAAAVGLILMSFLTGKWSWFLVSLAAGILSGITGIMLLRAPLSGAAALTLVISAFLLVTGIYRAISAAVMQFPNW